MRIIDKDSGIKLGSDLKISDIKYSSIDKNILNIVIMIIEQNNHILSANNEILDILLYGRKSDTHNICL